MSEPLWSDERLIAESKSILRNMGWDDDAPNGFKAIAMLKAARVMRDDYEAALDGAKKDGFDAAVADGDTLDAWKERAWQAEKRIADLEGQKNVDSMAQYRGIFPYDPDGPSSEERVRRSRDGDEQDMIHRRIDKLADRIALLERVQREGQGEL